VSLSYFLISEPIQTYMKICQDHYVIHDRTDGKINYSEPISVTDRSQIPAKFQSVAVIWLYHNVQFSINTSFIHTFLITDIWNYTGLTWRTDEWHVQSLLEFDDPQNPMQSSGDPCENDGAASPQITDHCRHHYTAPLQLPHSLAGMTANKQTRIFPHYFSYPVMGEDITAHINSITLSTVVWTSHTSSDILPEHIILETGMSPILRRRYPYRKRQFQYQIVQLL
jgi:hypothetical protein